MRSVSTWHRALIAAGVAWLSAACTDEPPTAARHAAPALVAASLTTAPDAALASLGDRIFDDRNLSIRRNQSCADCHSAEWGFTGPLPEINAAGAVYEGSIPGRFGDRKPPSSAYSTLSPVLALTRGPNGEFVGGSFWDGRATGERLGSAAAEQALGPFTNPMEQALPDVACVVYRVSRAPYAPDYLSIWGDAILDIDFPDDTDVRCSQEGATIALGEADRARVLAEYDNIGRSIAAYEASHNTFSSRFDAWRRGEPQLSDEERRGFALFQGRARCAACHTTSGSRPAFTDHGYENLGVPPNPVNPALLRDPAFVDLGLGGYLASTTRWAALATLERGKMRVPTLRNVDLRPAAGGIKAYMHNGVFKSLEEVVHFYNTRDALPRCATGTSRAEWGATCWPAPEVEANVNRRELGNLGLTPAEERALVAFLRTLSDRVH